jgi:hypothetical protein
MYVVSNYVQCNKRSHHIHSKSALLFAVGWRSVDLGWATRMLSFSLSCVLGICRSVQLACLYVHSGVCFITRNCSLQ